MTPDETATDRRGQAWESSFPQLGSTGLSPHLNPETPPPSRPGILDDRAGSSERARGATVKIKKKQVAFSWGAQRFLYLGCWVRTRYLRSWPKRIGSGPFVANFNLFSSSNMPHLQYRDRLIHKLQVLWKWGQNIAFFCLLQAGKRNFLSSYSRNLGFVD